MTGDIRVDKPLDARAWFDVHDDLEFGMVLKGVMRRHWGPHMRDLEPGEVWLHDAYEPHGYQIVQAPCDLVFLIFKAGLLRGIRFPGIPSINWLAPFHVPVAERGRVAPERRDTLLNLGHRFANAVRQRPAAGDVRVLLAFLEILLTLIEDNPPDVPPHHDGERDTAILRAADQAMQSRRLITTEMMAERLALQVDHFSRRFGKEMGVSFAKFGLRCRMNGVAQDLSLTDLPIKAIAADWDFSTESHLHRVFRRHFGCTPNTFRLRHRGSKHADKR